MKGVLSEEWFNLQIARSQNKPAYKKAMQIVLKEGYNTIIREITTR
jgi:uncharacterized protein YfbU (UPF0304 family)